jgi:tellurite resistance protein TerC
MVWAWAGFIVFICLMLAIDLGVLNRKHHVISMREAMAWFGVWVGLAVAFDIGLVIFHTRGVDAGLEFLTGFLVEKSLSIDNVFVFILIFNYFQIPSAFQHKILSFGILGAILLRIVFILGGIALLQRFHWMTYLFGLFLIGTGTMMLLRKETEYKPGSNWANRLLRRFLPISEISGNGNFFVRLQGRLMATPLLIALIAIESADIIFAADSIPATFAITTDPFIVFTSNIFAMLGLRALYFAVQGFMKMFHFLHYGFAIIILVLGTKMLIHNIYKLPISISLLVIVLILMLCVIMSLLRPRKADLKQLFERTEQLGLIPFRHLLMIENVVDMGEMKVEGSMRKRSEVKALRLDLNWEENLEMMRKACFSRYPVLETEYGVPIGVIHLKSILMSPGDASITSDSIRCLTRPLMRLRGDLSLEAALSKFQRRFDRLAIVHNEQNEWIGILTFEDLVQELVGNMGDEFDQVREGDKISLFDSLRVDSIFLDLESHSIDEAIPEIVNQIPVDQLPLARDRVSQLLTRQKTTKPIYWGDGIAVVHARIPETFPPFLAFARSDQGIAIGSGGDRAELLFLLLTSSSMPRLQPRLLANIDGLFKSEYVSDRLRKALTPDSVLEAIRAGEQVPVESTG